MADTAVVASVLSLVVLVFIATGLSVAVKKVRVPFAVVLVLAGLLIGELLRAYPALEPLAGLGLSRDILIYVFLPTLVFEVSFAIDSRLLLKNILPVMVLAVPAVLISFVVIGYGMHWAVSVPLGAALLFGALISNTDSTAVLAIFKDIGAPKRLTIMAQGENLLNDAVSIVIFGLVLSALGIGGAEALATGGSPVITGSIAFLVTFFGGLASGLVTGYIFGKMIEAVENDDLIEILLTTVVAYTSFLTAEFVFGVSGITAVVGAGVMLGGWGRTKFSPDTLQYLNRFWAYLAFIVGSLVFLLVGLAIDLSSLAGHAWLILAGAVVAVLARWASISGLFPVINVLPGVERTDFRYQVAMVWGGLRGATALVLAMSLPAAYAQKDLVVELTVGAVLFSLLVQGFTLQPVIRLLGLNRVVPEERYARDESELAVKRRARSRIPDLRRGGVISESVATQLEKEYQREEQVVREKLAWSRQHELAGPMEELRLLRRQLLLIEKRSYRDLFHRAVLSEKVFKELQHSIDVQLDHLRSGHALPQWTIHSPFRWRLESWLFRLFDALRPASELVQRYRLNRIAERYEENWGRVVACTRVHEELETLAAAGAYSEGAVAELSDQYARWARSARKRLDLIGEQFPEYATQVQEIVAARLCLQAEETAIGDLMELGVLPEREAKGLRGEVEAKLRRLRRKPVGELQPYPRELLAKVPFFRGLPPEEFDRLVEILRPRTFLAEERIVRQGDIGDSLFLIGRGVVRVTVGRDGEGEKPIATLLAGDFFGEMAVLTASPRTANVSAATDCVLYELRRPDLEVVQEACPTMRQVLEAAYRERMEGLRAQGAEREPSRPDPGEEHATA